MKVTIHDVAKRAQVGVSTVSRVLNNNPEVSKSTRAKVLGICAELGYRPSSAARSLVLGRTETVGVLIAQRHTPVFLNPFYAEILGGIEAALESAGYHLLINSVKTGKESLQQSLEGRVDGLLVVGCDISEQLLNRICDLHIPAVLVNHSYPGLPSVTADDYGGALSAVRHLIDNGHKRVAFVCEDLSNPSFKARLAGYRAALAEAGLPEDPALTADGGNTWQGGYHAMRTVLNRAAQPPDAVFGANDAAALTAMRALFEAGYDVPEQVAVIGFDDIFLAASHYPSLSTVKVEKQAMGRTATELLLKHIAGEAVDETAPFATSLLLRDSSPPRKDDRS